MFYHSTIVFYIWLCIFVQFVPNPNVLPGMFLLEQTICFSTVWYSKYIPKYYLVFTLIHWIVGSYCTERKHISIQLLHPCTSLRTTQAENTKFLLYNNVSYVMYPCACWKLLSSGSSISNLSYIYIITFWSVVIIPIFRWRFFFHYGIIVP